MDRKTFRVRLFINVLSLGEIQKGITKLSGHNAVMTLLENGWTMLIRFKAAFYNRCPNYIWGIYAETIKL